jgi:NDP-sugar pyrophosphorylase family protein
MKVAIIAAGVGERLRQAGWRQPKPLVPVAGKPLIDHVLAAVTAAGLDEVACIVNEESHGIETHCRERWPDVHFAFVRRSTPSSMESLFTLAPLLAEARFLLLTADAVFAPAVLTGFLAAAARRPEAAGVLAVNAFVDDEKPLWVALAADGRITDLGKTARPAAPAGGLVTAGFYVLEPRVFAEAEDARRRGCAALRDFLAHLLAGGHRLYGELVGKSVDVDRPHDIQVAEAFVRSGYGA